MILMFLLLRPFQVCYFFFFNDTATTEIYTLSLHDALPISTDPVARTVPGSRDRIFLLGQIQIRAVNQRSEEHTSELQSPDHLVCRLLLEKKKLQTSLGLPSRRARLGSYKPGARRVCIVTTG